jgi:hypothetical protein
LNSSTIKENNENIIIIIIINNNYEYILKLLKLIEAILKRQKAWVTTGLWNNTLVHSFYTIILEKIFLRNISECFMLGQTTTVINHQSVYPLMIG